MGSVDWSELVSSDRYLHDTLTSSSQSFLQPPPNLYPAALAQAKLYIDPLASATSKAQEDRLQSFRKRRKRGQSDGYDARNTLRLKQLYVDGFSVDQIWEQARRALDASRLEVERSLRTSHAESDTLQSSRTASNSFLETSERKRKSQVDFTIVDESADGIQSTDNNDVEAKENGREDDEEGSTEDDLVDSHEESELDTALSRNVSDEDDVQETSFEELDELEDLEEGPSNVFVPDRNGLNDGFFSVDDFNKQADFLEQRDARGEDDGAASDEEDVDWETNPLAEGAMTKLNDAGEDDGASGSEDDDAGPTFGNVDLSGLDSASENDPSDSNMEIDEPSALNNTNSIRYADFFEPPPRRISKGESGRRALPKTQPHQTPMGGGEEDMQRTMDVVRRDIFEDNLTPDEDEVPSDPEDRRSSHQKRQAALTAEIRRLEAAAIQKREWTLSGEARAADRPMNSLLEEDLEFERVGKPVPIITQEVSEDIESLIKRRILAREFDEVIRRRPGNLATGGGKNGQRRGVFELSDAKPEQSLAEIYETKHLQKTDPNAHPSKADQKLEAEQKRIEALWKDVSAKLDALSSWHYRPKPPSAEVTVVADVPTISMEDARPNGVGGDVGAESMLAPQEIYQAGESRDKAKEVVSGGGLPIGRAEMTREEKLRRRRREKEKIRKSGEGVGAKKGQIGGKKAEEKRNVVKDLKKGGVGIIGRKGEIHDVQGNAVKGQQLGKGAGGYKL